MANTNIDGIKTIKAYFRTSSKYAKIAHLLNHISTDELYLYASQNYNLLIENIHLYYQGKVLPTSSMTTLEENAIIHIVRLDELKKEMINITVKMIAGNRSVKRFQIDANMLVRRFIDDCLYPANGVNSSHVFLVHLGKQLKLDRTFRQQQIENGSELLCLYLQDNPNQSDQAQRDDVIYVVNVPIKELETPEAPKDIYPKTDFAIDVPQGIDTKNSLNLIFDSKIRHSSSIQNIDLDPSEIILEEEDSRLEADITRRNQSYQSEHGDARPRQSRFSEEWNKQRRVGSEQYSRLNAQDEHIDFKGGDFIYTGDYHILKESNVMGDLITSYKQKLKQSFESNKHKV